MSEQGRATIRPGSNKSGARNKQTNQHILPNLHVLSTMCYYLILLQYLEEEGFEEDVVLTPDVAVVKVAKEKIMNEKTSTHASCRRVCTTT